MKTTLIRWGLAAGWLALAAGCAGVDSNRAASRGLDERVVEGRITCPSLQAMPDHASVLVRVVAPSVAGGPPTVLGEQTIDAPAGWPVAFRVEYRADDATLRRGVNLDARVSAGGRLRFQTVNRHVVTEGNTSSPHEVAVEPLRR